MPDVSTPLDPLTGGIPDEAPEAIEGFHRDECCPDDGTRAGYGCYAGVKQSSTLCTNWQVSCTELVYSDQACRQKFEFSLDDSALSC